MLETQPLVIHLDATVTLMTMLGKDPTRMVGVATKLLNIEQFLSLSNVLKAPIKTFQQAASPIYIQRNLRYGDSDSNILLKVES
jgi:hypothetical protein